MGVDCCPLLGEVCVGATDQRTCLLDFPPPSFPAPSFRSFDGSDARDQGVDVEKPEAEMPGPLNERGWECFWREMKKKDLIQVGLWAELFCDRIGPSEAPLTQTPVLV